MAQIPAFYSTYEIGKPPRRRVHHNNGDCPLCRAIPKHERIFGTGGYPVCRECERLNGNEPDLKA
jgi:hypothetical protein